MKYTHVKYLVLFACIVQVGGIRPTSFTGSHISFEEKQRLKKLDYYATLALIALSTGEFDGYAKVPGVIADFAVTDLACKGLCKYTGLKDKQWAMPLLPFMALGGKQVIKYGIAACKSGYACKDDLQKRYGNWKWAPYFVTGLFIPYLLRKEITGKVFHMIDDKTGLTSLEYPQWILGSSLLTVLAWQFHGAIVDWFGNLIQSVYDTVVPETRVEKYVRIKRALQQIAKA